MRRYRLDFNSPTRYRYEKYIWYAQIPLAVGCFVFDRPLWNTISILYLVILSQWAPASTADGNEESAKAREHLETDRPIGEQDAAAGP